MGRVIVMNPDGDPDKDCNMVQHLLGMYLPFLIQVCIYLYLSVQYLLYLGVCYTQVISLWEVVIVKTLVCHRTDAMCQWLMT